MRFTLFGTITQAPLLRWGLVCSAFCLLVQWLLVGFFVWQLPPEIPLWYSEPTGKLQLADRGWYLLLPGATLALFILNLGFIKLGLGTLRVYAFISIWLTTLIVFLMTIAMVHIIFMAL